MAEQRKRGARLEDGDHGHGGKKARALAMVIKQEQQEIGEEDDKEEEQAEGEAGQGSGAGALVPVEAMAEEPHINLMFPPNLFLCRACLLPLGPPTFKCEAGHVVCGTCRDSHGQVCGAAGAGAYAACVDVDAFVRCAKQPCANEEFGCKSVVVYHKLAEHHRACPWAPCCCPVPGCGFRSSPAWLADHFAAAHSWPVTEVRYGRPQRLPLPPPRGWHVLVGDEGEGGGERCVFLLSPAPLGAAAAVSLVCVRANGGAAGGAPQFRCRLWAEAASSKESMAMMASAVRSSDLSGGFSSADQEMFLAVPPEILHDASGGEPAIMVRIDRAAGAAAGMPTTPPVRTSRTLQ